MMVIGKVDGRLVEIIRTAETVQFSSEHGWICVCFDFERDKRHQQNVKWIPATTRFEWVRHFSFDAE